jgi:hypothetical protein
LSHSIKSSSHELFHVMILYNLPPSLHHHYSRFNTTTRQSVPARHIGFRPLGRSHCVPPFTLPCRFPSSVTKPGYTSCRLYDACRTVGKQVSTVLLHPVPYSVAFDRLWQLLDTSSTVHLRSARISIPNNLVGLSFPNRSVPWLLTKAPLGGLMPPPVR